MPAYSVTDPPVLAFLVLPLAVAALFVWGTAVAWRHSGDDGAAAVALKAACGCLLWMGATLGVADRGTLRAWDRTPPPFALLVVAIVVLAAWIAASQLGRRLAAGVPLWALVAVQAFRLPLEIAMHALVGRGIMPEQMSYGGRNFDILTGASAIVVAALVRAGAGGRWLVAVWNVMGLTLLINVVAVAVLSTPRIRLFGDDRLNVFVTYPPFVWLPAVLVLAALAGHLVVFRALGGYNPSLSSGISRPTTR
jgi:hypothetical protein